MTIDTPTLEPSLFGFTTSGSGAGSFGSRRTRGSTMVQRGVGRPSERQTVFAMVLSIASALVRMPGPV